MKNILKLNKEIVQKKLVKDIKVFLKKEKKKGTICSGTIQKSARNKSLLKIEKHIK